MFTSCRLSAGVVFVPPVPGFSPRNYQVFRNLTPQMALPVERMETSTWVDTIGSPSILARRWTVLQK
jgi:hypothetical protein